jgi:glycosyl transferase family 25
MEGVIYINLAHRPDRKASILKNLSDYGFDMSKVHRVDAVLNAMCGHIGCGESHVKAIEMAIQNNWKETLVLEDDFIFTQPVNVVKKMLNNLRSVKYDVVLLAEGYKNLEKSDYPFLKKVITCTTTSGYMVRRHYYETLLNNFKESVEVMKNELKQHINKHGQQKTKLNYCSAIDQYWFSLQQKDTFYITNPVLGNQNSSYSDNNCSQEHQKTIINKFLAKSL